MASSMAEISTVDMGFRPVARRTDEMEVRLLDKDEADERADATEDEGELDRGVEISESGAAYEYDAMARVTSEGEKKRRRKRALEEKRVRRRLIIDEVLRPAAAAELCSNQVLHRRYQRM